MIGKIHSIETFGTVDGPGIRYVIFLQGCNLRCAYCHNPDTWNLSGGVEYTTDVLIADISKYSRYIEGITVSGGEPLLQMDFVIELFKKAREIGLNTCIDTSGSIFNISDEDLLKKMDELCDVTDLFMLDIKHIDEDKHIFLTGKSNKNILNFAKYLDARHQEMWLRYVLVPTINSDVDTLKKWKQFADTLESVTNIELLPYHTMAINKYKSLGIEYRLKDIPEPSENDIAKAKEILKI